MAKDAFGNPAKERDEMPFHTPLPNLKNRHCILITEVPVFLCHVKQLAEECDRNGYY